MQSTSGPHSVPPVCIIGGGHMGHAIYFGAAGLGPGAGGAVDGDDRLAGQLLDPAATVVAEPNELRRTLFAADVCGARFAPAAAFESATEGLRWLVKHEAATPGARGQVILAVKPQLLETVTNELTGLGDAVLDRVWISILAGTTTQRLARALGPRARIVRVMPNLAVQHGLGMSAIAFGGGVRDADAEWAVRLFGGLGAVIRIEESLMDAFTALAGSGPAYVFHLAEAMTRAGATLGLTPAQADTIVRQTIAGAAKMLKVDPRLPDELRAAVTSKGGTTAAALEVLDGASALDLWLRAITAARDRGRELAAS